MRLWQGLPVSPVEEDTPSSSPDIREMYFSFVTCKQCRHTDSSTDVDGPVAGRCGGWTSCCPTNNIARGTHLSLLSFLIQSICPLRLIGLRTSRRRTAGRARRARELLQVFRRLLRGSDRLLCVHITIPRCTIHIRSGISCCLNRLRLIRHIRFRRCTFSLKCVVWLHERAGMLQR